MKNPVYSKGFVRIAIIILFVLIPVSSGNIFCQEANIPLPSSLGFFLWGGGSLAEMNLVNVTTIIGLPLRSLNTGYAIDGLSGTPRTSTVSTRPVIVAYQQSIEVNDYILCDSVFVKTMQAYQLNIQNTDKRFFSNVYAKGYYDVVDINLWRPNNEIPLTIEPVVSNPGMYKFTPRSELSPGYYVFYKKGSVHKNKMVFTADDGRNTTAFFFEIAPKEEAAGQSAVDALSDTALIGVLKKLLVNVRNYDIRWSVAPGATATSKEKSMIIESLDKADEHISKALSYTTGVYSMDFLVLLQRTSGELAASRNEYMQNRSGKKRIYAIEREMSAYLKTIKK